jgi:hypothetical protein
VLGIVQRVIAVWLTDDAGIARDIAQIGAAKRDTTNKDGASARSDTTTDRRTPEERRHSIPRHAARRKPLRHDSRRHGTHQKKRAILPMRQRLRRKAHARTPEVTQKLPSPRLRKRMFAAPAPTTLPAERRKAASDRRRLLCR